MYEIGSPQQGPQNDSVSTLYDYNVDNKLLNTVCKVIVLFCIKSTCSYVLIFLFRLY